jgi:predicted nuclease of predicted toxin-antitoxin system
MKFLIDEDVPVKVLKTLAALGHDTVRVTHSTKDPQIARQAVESGRILITLDKDFSDKVQYPPSTFNIIHLRIHPPFADDLINALKQLLQEVPESNLTGFIVLRKEGHLRIPM